MRREVCAQHGMESRCSIFCRSKNLTCAYNIVLLSIYVQISYSGTVCSILKFPLEDEPFEFS